MSEALEGGPSQRRRLLFALIPLAAFMALAALFYFRLGSDTQRLPSALIGRPAPQVTLPPLPGTNLPGLSGEDLRARLGDGRQHFRELVRPVPRRTSVPDEARRRRDAEGQGRAHRRASPTRTIRTSRCASSRAWAIHTG